MRCTHVDSSITNSNVVDDDTTIWTENILGAIMRDGCTIEGPQVGGDGRNVTFSKTIQENGGSTSVYREVTGSRKDKGGVT